MTLVWIVPGEVAQTGPPVDVLDRVAADAYIEAALVVFAGWELTYPDGYVEHCYTGTGHPRVWTPGPIEAEP